MMASYDYKKGKKRVQDILDKPNDTAILERFPNKKDFDFNKGYLCQITAIFVDIRDSTSLFDGKKSTISKVMRCFTSETIEILNAGGGAKKIGIRGDCVYGIYYTPNNEDVLEIVEKARYVNTVIRMLNSLFKDKKMLPIKIGIGIATSTVLVVRAGREDSGVDSNVWIGDAVASASNLSSYGNKEKYANESIVISQVTYDKVINQYVEEYGPVARKRFKECTFDKDQAYTCNLIVKDMNDWIQKGMKS